MKNINKVIDSIKFEPFNIDFSKYESQIEEVKKEQQEALKMLKIDRPEYLNKIITI